MSDSVRPHRRQPTRLPRPWDSPGKNTGVGCHFLLQCMKVKSESEVAESCPTLSDPRDCGPPGSSVHGIFQARVLEWGCHCLLRSICEEFLKRIVRDFFNDFQLSTWKNVSRRTWESLDLFRELKRVRQTAFAWLTQRLRSCCKNA